MKIFEVVKIFEVAGLTPIPQGVYIQFPAVHFQVVIVGADLSTWVDILMAGGYSLAEVTPSGYFFCRPESPLTKHFAIGMTLSNPELSVYYG